MFLRDLSIKASPQAQMPDSYSIQDFGRSASHVVEVFLTLVPPNTIRFDEMSKLSLVLGQSPRPEYERNFDGVAIFNNKEFDFIEYANLTTSQKTEKIATSLRITFQRIEEIAGCDSAALKDVLKQAESINFSRKVEVIKLSRSTKSRSHRLHVFIDVRPGQQKFGIDVRDRKKNLIETIILREGMNLGLLGFEIAKSRWKGSRYQIIDRVGRISFSVETKKFKQLSD